MFKGCVSGEITLQMSIMSFSRVVIGETLLGLQMRSLQVLRFSSIYLLHLYIIFIAYA